MLLLISKLLPFKRQIIAGLAGAGLLFLAWLWFDSQLSDAYDRGYDARQSELLEQNQALQQQLEAERARQRKSDAEQVRVVTQTKTEIKKVIEYVDRYIPQMDVSACQRLPVGFVRSINAVITGCTSETGADCTVPEAAVSGPLAVN